MLTFEMMLQRKWWMNFSCLIINQDNGPVPYYLILKVKKKIKTEPKSYFHLRMSLKQ